PESWRAITLRQLLAHTSGIPDYEANLGYDFYETDGGRQDILAAMSGEPLDFEPGTNFSYSNTGYYLLSLVIEATSGASYADFMQKRIFAPAGMKQTTIGADGLATLVQGYKSADGAITPVPGIAAESTLGAGALISTVADWNRWQNALASEKIVSAASRDLTFHPATLANGEEIPYGFGIIVDSFRGEARRMHTGQTSGFVARFESYPASDTSFLLLANCHGDRLGAMGKKLALAFVPGLDYSALALPSDPDPSMTARARSALEQAVLQDGALDLLADGMREFAAADDYAPLRTALAPSVRTLSSFEYLKTEEVGQSGSGRFVYKAVSDEGVLYWILSFKNGLLTGMNWEEA
ncbi:MAG: serine hydrolase domain-containing protein, partial [Amphiplicatus sp.]